LRHQERRQPFPRRLAAQQQHLLLPQQPRHLSQQRNNYS
jgi:hypothetical protein